MHYHEPIANDRALYLLLSGKHEWMEVKNEKAVIVKENITSSSSLNNSCISDSYYGLNISIVLLYDTIYLAHEYARRFCSVVQKKGKIKIKTKAL
jgi:hypothetical protein